MAADTTPAQLFFGRSTERDQFRRMLEGRAGGRLGFSGIGGIGKSALLREFLAEAQQLRITDYVIHLDLSAARLTADGPNVPITTPLDLIRALVCALEATGKTRARRALVFTKDTLAEVKSIADQLLAQSQALIQQNVHVTAENQSSIGNINPQVSVTVESRGRRVSIDHLLAAFRRLLSDELPSVVRLRPGSTMLPRRLVVLLVDNVERASRDVQQALRDLGTSLPENCLLVCVGREEDFPASGRSDALLRSELSLLDEPTVHAWLTRSGIDDRALQNAIYATTQGVPLLVMLALGQIDAARSQGHMLTSADFQLRLSAPAATTSREMAEQFLVERYLHRLEQGADEDQQLRDLILYGCVLRRFEPIESVRAIGAVAGDAGRLIRALEQRGFLSNRRMHEVLRRCAVAYLRAEEPTRFAELTTAMVRCYQQLGTAYTADLLYAEILYGADDTPQRLLALVTERCAASDLPGAADLIAAAQEASTLPSLRWTIDLAKVDLALAEGAYERATARLLPLLSADDSQSERDKLIKERIAQLPRPLAPHFQFWLIQREKPNAATVARLRTLSRDLTHPDLLALVKDTYKLMYEIACSIEDRQGQASALNGLGDVARQHADLMAAERYHTEALELYRTEQDRQGQADTLDNLGKLARSRDDLATAERYHIEALELYRTEQDRQGQANALRSLGKVAQQRTDLAAAERYYTEALTHYRAIGDRRGQAHALNDVGEVAWQHADLAAAERYHIEALELYRAEQDRQGQANALHGLAGVAWQHYDLAAAERYYTEALVLYRAIGDRQGQANTFQGFGLVARRRADLAAAERYYKEALALYRAIGNGLGRANALHGLGDTAQQRTDLTAAERYYTEALTIYRNIQNLLGQANVLNSLGETAQQRTDLTAAERYYTEALTLYRNTNNPLGQTNVLNSLGSVAFARKSVEEARQYAEQARLLAQAIEYLPGIFRSLNLLTQITESEGNAAEANRYRVEAQYVERDLRKRL